MNKVIVQCVFIILLYKHANAFPGGAPSGTCISMKPSPTKHGQPQNDDAPYVIQVDKSYYAMNDTVKVYIKSCKDGMEIAGFLIQAREEDQNIPLGDFAKIPSNTRLLDCTANNAETEVRLRLYSEDIELTNSVTMKNVMNYYSYLCT